MRCLSPRDVGFKADGKTLSWTPRTDAKEFAKFKLPCGKCIECRLDYARQWAIRCVHEADMYENNAFVTLTYSDEHLKDPKLDYSDFQKFMKKIRKLQDEPIGVFVTGEYGEKTKRKHWHAILFNYRPKDAAYKYTNARGDRVYDSESLTRIWGHGITEFGSVTFESAGYCARYAAKKLVHGRDGDHEFNPVSKKSNKHAIGKKWLERNYKDVFNHGRLILEDGTTSSIPRYYEKWFRDNHPTEWMDYVTEVKTINCALAEIQESRKMTEYWALVNERNAKWKQNPLTPNEVRLAIIKQKFQLLQEKLKL